MKANKYISKREHKLILVVSFLAFVFPASIFFFQVAKDYNLGVYEEQTAIRQQANGQPPLKFSGGATGYSIPGLYLSSLFIFIALIRPKRFIFSSLLTVFYALSIIYVFYFRLNNTFGELRSGFIEQMQIVIYDYDYIVLALALILFFWQISILARMLIKNTQREIELP